MCVSVCVCVCLCICIYIYIYRYADGQAHIKWHADSESCYGDSHSSTIASVSFGAPRIFCLRRKLQDEEGRTRSLLRAILLQPVSSSSFVMRVSSFSYDMLGAEAGLAAGDGGDYAGFLAGTREGGREGGMERRIFN